MTPDEVLRELEKLGIKITRRTLLNYEKWGLIPEPVRGGAGRGKGRTTHCPDHTTAEAYASWVLMKKHNVPVKDVAEARSKAKQIEGTDEEKQTIFDMHRYAEYIVFGKAKQIEGTDEEKQIIMPPTRLDIRVDEWLNEKARILCGLRPHDNLVTSPTDFWETTPDGGRHRKVMTFEALRDANRAGKLSD